jgi:hypothetical protein
MNTPETKPEPLPTAHGSAFPSRRRRHVRTANSIVALLDAAWRCRLRGERETMRELALDAATLTRRWKLPVCRQTELSL